MLGRFVCKLGKINSIEFFFVILFLEGLNGV